MTDRHPSYLADPSASYGHVPSLDGFRALSIIAVLLTHFVAPQGPGGYGVFLFFIISGYLITRLLFAERRRQAVDLKAFYIRRFFRLYPVLVVFCFITVATNYWRGPAIAFDEIAAALFYYSNFLIVHKELNQIPWQLEALRVFWSLSIEEHFYLIFPFLFLATPDPKRLIWLSLAVIVACTVGRYTMANAYPERVATHYFGMLTQYRIDSIALGVLLAAVCETPAGQLLVRRADRYWVLGIAFAVLAAGFIFLRDPALKIALRWPMLGFPLLVIMSAVLFSPRLRLAIAALNHPVMVWTGKLSYSLYVWHMLAGYVAFTLLPTAAGAVLALVLSYTFAAVSYFLVEQPMIRLGKGVRSRRSTLTAGETAASDARS